MRPKLKAGDRVVFDWELEYVASQGVTVTECDARLLDTKRMVLEALEAGAWEHRMDDDGVVALGDCNVVSVRCSIIRDDETIYEGTFEDGLNDEEEA